MQIETKFNVGQNVYFLSVNKVHDAQVMRIVVEASYQYDADAITRVKYELRGKYILDEAQVFTSKQDLIDNL